MDSEVFSNFRDSAASNQHVDCCDLFFFQIFTGFNECGHVKTLRQATDSEKKMFKLCFFID